MSFELIMLLGFFGTALLALLPACPGKTAADSFRRGRRQRRRAEPGRRAVAGNRHAWGQTARQGGVKGVPGDWPVAA